MLATADAGARTQLSSFPTLALVRFSGSLS
jgi:hypothetical protein